MRVYDCFILFNEIDLLELRLNELWDVVDIFVIVEARLSFSGNPKPLCLELHRDRLAKYSDKIRTVVLDGFPAGLDDWGKESFQRNALHEALNDLRPDDIVMLSDVDEIPRARVVQDILSVGIRPRQVYCLALEWFAFYFNVKLKELWDRQGPRMIRAADLQTFQGLRRVKAPTQGWARDMMRQIKASHQMGAWVKRIRVADAGWHFTWMGGTQSVALKGSSIAAHSDLPAGDKTTDWANQRMDTLLKDKSRYTLVEIDDDFPAFVREHPEMFAQYVLPRAL